MTQEETRDSTLPAKFTIRRGDFEISMEGRIPAIIDELDNLVKLVNVATEKLGLEEVEVTPSKPALEEEVAPSAADVPVIKPTRVTAENVLSLFSTPWGRTPRTVAEVLKALELNAVPDKRENVSMALLTLTRRGELRRIQKEGKWSYFRIPASE